MVGANGKADLGLVVRLESSVTTHCSLRKWIGSDVEKPHCRYSYYGTVSPAYCVFCTLGMFFFFFKADLVEVYSGKMRKDSWRGRGSE